MAERDELIRQLTDSAWDRFSMTPRMQKVLTNSPGLAATFEFIYTMGVLEGGKLAGEVAQAQLQELQQLKDKTVADLFAKEDESGLPGNEGGHRQ